MSSAGACGPNSAYLAIKFIQKEELSLDAVYASLPHSFTEGVSLNELKEFFESRSYFCELRTSKITHSLMDAQKAILLLDTKGTPHIKLVIKNKTSELVEIDTTLLKAYKFINYDQAYPMLIVSSKASPSYTMCPVWVYAFIALALILVCRCLKKSP